MEEGIELMDILRVFWKRRFLIIIGVFICTIAAGITSFIIKPVYEISALVRPGKIVYQDQSGRFEEISIQSPEELANNISEETYNSLVARDLKIPLKELPKIEAEKIKDTFLVRIFTEDHDIERGKGVLNSVIKFLRKDIDEKVDAEMKMIDSRIEIKENEIKSLNISIEEKRNEIKEIELQIQSKEIQKTTLKGEIETTKNKIKICEERMKEILNEMKVVKERTDRLEEEMRKALREVTDDKSAIPMLLYSNEIQNNLRYHNILEERLGSEKVNFENLNLAVHSKEQEIEQLNTDIAQIRTKIEGVKNDIEKIKVEIEGKKIEINSLKEQKRRIEWTTVVKPPTPSVHPVFPKKKLNVALSFILSFMIFSFLAFFLEYIEKHRKHLSNV